MALKAKSEPRKDKQIKQAESTKNPQSTRIAVQGVASVRVLDGACVVVADGVEKLIDGKRASIVIEG